MRADLRRQDDGDVQPRQDRESHSGSEGVGLDLDLPGRIERPGDDEHRRGGTNLAEHLAVRASDRLPVGRVDDVDPRADHVLGLGAELAQGFHDDRQAALRLLVRVVRLDADGSGPGDVDVTPVPHGAAVPDRVGVGRDRWNGGARHVPSIPWVEALRAIEGWGAGTAAAGVALVDAVVATHGPSDAELPWASVTKLLTGLAILVALEEGTVDLDKPAGPPRRDASPSA